MIKAILITGSLCLAVGTIGGYFLQKIEAQTSIPKPQTATTPAKTDEAIAANITKKTDRQTLILKLSLCLNRKLNKAFIDSLTDKQLNDITYEACQS